MYQNNREEAGTGGVTITIQLLQIGYMRCPELSSFEIIYLQTELNRIKKNLVNDCHGVNLLGKKDLRLILSQLEHSATEAYTPMPS